MVSTPMGAADGSERDWAGGLQGAQSPIANSIMGLPHAAPRMDSDKRIHQLDTKLEAWRYRVKDADERKTYDEVFDRRTLMTLQRLISQGIIDVLEYPVSTGKEGNVFRASTAEGEARAVKIYRVSNATFKNLGRYIIGDPRFLRVARDRRKLILAWATKEFKNLQRMAASGTRVPRALHVKDNVLIMDYLGDAGQPAPALRQLTHDAARPLVPKVIEDMVHIREAELVHGDLSEYNILAWQGEPFVIDVGQAVPLDHPQAEEWFQRDVLNMSRYFKRLDVDISPKDLAKRVKGG